MPRAEQVLARHPLVIAGVSAKIVKGYSWPTALIKLEEAEQYPHKFYSIVLWKTQNQQNKKLQNGNLVALRRGLASIIITGGDASINPRHLSFLIGGTDKI